MGLPTVLHLSVTCSVLVLLALLIPSAESGSSTRFPGQDRGSLAEVCALHPMVQGEGIAPLLELETLVRGCSSRNISAKSQEVHAIRVGKMGPGMGTLPLVRLLVKPRLERSTHAGPLVIVLGSPAPVRWQLATERLPNTSRIEVFISAGSEVVPVPPVQPAVESKPMLFDELISLVESRYHILTSYSLVQFASSVILKVGVDPAKPATCNKSLDDGMTHVESYFVLPQPIKTCSLDHASDKDGKEVYVINLSSSMGRKSVVVQLVSRGGVRLKKTYVLVLKCRCDLEKWDVESAPGIQGTLEIVTESSVTSEATSYLLSVKVRTLRLPDGYKELLSHVEHVVGMPHSYVESEGASRIQVLVDDNGRGEGLLWSEMLPPSSYYAPILPEWSIPKEHNSSSASAGIAEVFKEKTHVGVRMHSASSVDGSVAGRPPEASLETRNGPDETTEGLKDSSYTELAQEVVVSCTAEEIMVALPRYTIDGIVNRALGGSVVSLKNFQDPDIAVTLKEPTCKAQENSTHYILKSSLTSCGGEIQRQTGQAKVHLHQVLVWLPSMSRHFMTSIPREEGRSDDHEDYDTEMDSTEDGSGSNGTDLGELLLSVDVQCTQGGPSVVSASIKRFPDSKEDVFVSPLYHMDLYLDQEYTKHISETEFPISLPVNSIIYAKVEIRNAPSLCITVDECWLTNTSRPEAEQTYKWTILRNSCPTQIGVKLQHIDTRLPTALPIHVPCWKRFSFVLDEDLLGQSVLLKCQLDACSVSPTPAQNILKQCQGPEEHCNGHSLKLYLTQSAGKYSGLEVRGPIRVFPKEEMNAITGPSPRRPPFLNPFAKQYAVDEKVNRGNQWSLVPAVDTGLNKVSLAPPTNVHQAAGASSSHIPVIVVGVMTEAVVGIALSSFAIGVSLVSLIWYIHTRTDPRRRSRRNHQATSAGPHHRSRPCSLPHAPPGLPLRASVPLQPRC